MRIIDLTLPVYDGMPVFPGDPEISVELVHTIESHGWNLRKLTLSTHAGTHVNVPSHVSPDGKALDDYSLDAFVGESILFRSPDDVGFGTGLIFSDVNITKDLADLIVSRSSRFVGLSCELDIDFAIEKYLLENGIILFENLAQTHLLPRRFFFHGAPLKIRKGDGCPVRAYAIVANDSVS